MRQEQSKARTARGADDAEEPAPGGLEHARVREPRQCGDDGVDSALGNDLDEALVW